MTYFRYIGTQTIIEIEKKWRERNCARALYVWLMLNTKAQLRVHDSWIRQRKKNLHPTKIPVTHLAKTTILITLFVGWWFEKVQYISRCTHIEYHILHLIGIYKTRRRRKKNNTQQRLRKYQFYRFGAFLRIYRSCAHTLAHQYAIYAICTLHIDIHHCQFQWSLPVQM